MIIENCPKCRGTTKERKMSGQIDPLFENHPEVVERKRQQAEFIKQMFAAQRPGRPSGSNADEWHMFLSEYLDNRATSPSGLPFIAVQIAEAIDAAEKRDEQLVARIKRSSKYWGQTAPNKWFDVKAVSDNYYQLRGNQNNYRLIDVVMGIRFSDGTIMDFATGKTVRNLAE